MRKKAWKHSSSAGFTLLEVLFVVAIIGMTSVMALESFRTYAPRLELRQAAGQAAQLIQRTRLEAIKQGITTVVEADLDERTLTAFAEVNGNAAAPLTADARYLIYDPDPLVPPDRTDYLIATMGLPGKEATGSQFGGPMFGLRGADSVVGFTNVSQAPSDAKVKTAALVFLPTGAVVTPGAFRFADARGANYLETALTSLTGDVEVRKYLEGSDAPSGGVPDFFVESNLVFSEQQDTAIGRNVWVWY